MTRLTLFTILVASFGAACTDDTTNPDPTDGLPPGEQYAWRPGQITPDMASLGAAMAADTDVAKCSVARMWNWAMGKGDIVDLLVEVPTETIQAQVDAFTQGGFKMKDLIYAIYTSDDFVKF